MNPFSLHTHTHTHTHTHIFLYNLDRLLPDAPLLVNDLTEI